MLKFDSGIMYIIGMRNLKKIFSFNLVKTMDFHSVVLPLILFGIGILIPMITDEFLLIVMTFVPFYGYMLWNEKNLNESSIFVIRCVFVLSIFLGMLLSLIGHNLLDFVETSGIVLTVNIVPSFVFMIYVIFSVESKDPSKWSNYTIPPSS